MSLNFTSYRLKFTVLHSSQIGLAPILIHESLTIVEQFLKAVESEGQMFLPP